MNFRLVCLFSVSQVCELQTDGDNIVPCDFSSLSDVDYGKPCAAPHLQGPTFSKQEYYTKLEELKREHLRNIAELEKLNLSQIKPGQRERQLITCWRQNGEDTERSAKKKETSQTKHGKYISIIVIAIFNTF